MHLAAGAKRVVITAPAKDDDGADGQTVLMGVNEDDLEGVPDHVERFMHNEFGVAGDSGLVGKSRHHESDAFNGALIHGDAGDR